VGRAGPGWWTVTPDERGHPFLRIVGCSTQHHASAVDARHRGTDQRRERCPPASPHQMRTLDGPVPSGGSAGRPGPGGGGSLRVGQARALCSNLRNVQEHRSAGTRNGRVYRLSGSRSRPPPRATAGVGINARSLAVCALRGSVSALALGLPFARSDGASGRPGASRDGWAVAPAGTPSGAQPACETPCTSALAVPAASAIASVAMRTATTRLMSPPRRGRATSRVVPITTSRAAGGIGSRSIAASHKGNCGACDRTEAGLDRSRREASEGQSQFQPVAAAEATVGIFWRARRRWMHSEPGRGLEPLTCSLRGGQP
jgi:hypothetical protein